MRCRGSALSACDATCLKCPGKYARAVIRWTCIVSMTRWNSTARRPSQPLYPCSLRSTARLKNFSIAASMYDRRRVYWRRREILAAGMVRLGLPLLPLPPGSEAASILTVGVPETLGFDAFYAAVKDRGYLIYACKPPLAPKYFQIAVMGELADDELHEFLEILQSLMTIVPARYLPMLAQPAGDQN